MFIRIVDKEDAKMGRIFRFYKDVDTDQIIASQYLLFPTIDEMKEHAFESLDREFAAKVRPGDFVVADENFGCGSSREQAHPILIPMVAFSICILNKITSRNLSK